MDKAHRGAASCASRLECAGREHDPQGGEGAPQPLGHPVPQYAGLVLWLNDCTHHDILAVREQRPPGPFLHVRLHFCLDIERVIDEMQDPELMEKMVSDAQAMMVSVKK